MGPLSPRLGVTRYCGWKNDLQIWMPVMKTLQLIHTRNGKEIKYIRNGDKNYKEKKRKLNL
jgi:hypothetical protein